MKENEGVRRKARAAGVPLWRIALALGISEPTLMRWLRIPLEPEREAEILYAIDALSKVV